MIFQDTVRCYFKWRCNVKIVMILLFRTQSCQRITDYFTRLVRDQFHDTASNFSLHCNEMFRKRDNISCALIKNKMWTVICITCLPKYFWLWINRPVKNIILSSKFYKISCIFCPVKNIFLSCNLTQNSGKIFPVK